MSPEARFIPTPVGNTLLLTLCFYFTFSKNKILPLKNILISIQNLHLQSPDFPAEKRPVLYPPFPQESFDLAQG